MDILKEWLKSTIIRELSDGLGWLESGAADSPSTSATKISHFEDDGSNLRAKVSKPGVVQITKLVTFEEPIQAWVSDSVTRLLVIFAASAVRRFRHETKKRLTQDTLGGLIHIKDFEIVATHLGPRPSRLTILINDFQSLGSVGSGGFGLPRPVDALPEVMKLLDRLKLIRLREPHKNQQKFTEDAEDKNAPSGTQSEIMCSGDESGSGSQQNFATQVPRSRHAESAGVKPLKSNGISRYEKSDDALARRLNSRSVVRKPSKSPIRNLHTPPSTRNTMNRLQPSEFPSGKAPKATKNRSTDSINPADLLTLLTKSRMPHLIKRSVLGRPPVELAVLRNGDIDIGKEGLKGGADIDEGSDRTDALSVNHASLSKAQASVNSLEMLHNAGAKKDFGLAALPGSSRISRKEVRIPRDQQALLDGPDSWIPAEPGQRQPVGNIPIATLQKISNDAEGYVRSLPPQDRSPRQSLRKAKAAASASDSDSESESCHDSEPEVLISPEQWPPSSPPQPFYEQLPPDSSMAAPDQASELEKELGERFSARKRRKISHSPSSTASVISPAGSLTPVSKGSTNKMRLPSTSRATPVQEDGRISMPAVREGTETEAFTRERRSVAKDHGDDVSQTHSATGCAHTSQNISSVTQENMMNKPLTPKEEYSDMVHKDNINIIGDIPENTSNLDSSRLELEQETLNPPVSESTNNGLHGTYSLQYMYPSTATEPEEPVLQVEATPYVNGRLLKSASADLSPLLSPSRRKIGLLNNTTDIDKSNGFSPRPTVIELSSAEIQSSKPIDDTISECNYSERSQTNSISEYSRPGALYAQEVPERQDSGSHTPMNADDVTHVEDTYMFASTAWKAPDGNDLPDNRLTTTKVDAQSMKRKFIGLQPLSLHIAKRQKHLQSITFNFSQETQAIVDPSVLSSRYRQEFYGSRKSSISSIMKDTTSSPALDAQPLTPISYANCIPSEGVSKHNATVDEAPNLTSQKTKMARKSEINKISEALVLPEDEMSQEHASFEENNEATKSSYHAKDSPSPNTITVKAGVQSTHQIQVQNVGDNSATHLFDQFRATYPDYAATFKQFVAICRKMDRLAKNNHMEHQYLWDDFIVRHKTEYPTYLNCCADNAEDPLPYERFYRENIAKPLFTSGVVKPENLRSVLSPGQQEGAGDQQHRYPKNNSDVKNAMGETDMKRSISSPKESWHVRNPMSPKVTVDLTSDNETSSAKDEERSTNLSKKKSPRSLPWVISNKSQAENTPTRESNSRKPSSGHISISPLRSAPSSFKPLKILSWVGSSPRKVVSFSDDKGSTWVETTMESSKTGKALCSPGEDAKRVPMLDYPNSVEPSKSSSRQKGPNRDILSHKNKNSQESRLSAPKQMKPNRDNYSSTLRDDQASPELSLSTQQESLDETQSTKPPQAWWKDHNTPFANFARAYSAIRNGNGNSYAKDREGEQNETVTIPETVGDGPSPKQIDVSSWWL